MRTMPQNLRMNDRLADGSIVMSAEPVDHGAYVSVILRHDNGEIRIRDLDKRTSLEVQRPLITFGPTGQGIPSEDDHANRAADAYEHSLGL